MPSCLPVTLSRVTVRSSSDLFLPDAEDALDVGGFADDDEETLLVGVVLEADDFGVLEHALLDVVLSAVEGLGKEK